MTPARPSDLHAMLVLAMSLTEGQLKSVRTVENPGAEIHIARHGVAAVIKALDENHPGFIDRMREAAR